MSVSVSVMVGVSVSMSVRVGAGVRVCTVHEVGDDTRAPGHVEDGGHDVDVARHVRQHLHAPPG